MHEADSSPPSNSKVKNEWSCISIPPYVIMSYIKTADLYFSYLYFSMFALPPPWLIYIDEEGSMFH
jgi:hypothetical protein